MCSHALTDNRAYENNIIRKEVNIVSGLGARIFELYTNSVLNKKYLVYLHSVQTLRKQFASFAQTCDLHNMHNMHTTCAQNVRRYLIIPENMTHVSVMF